MVSVLAVDVIDFDRYRPTKPFNQAAGLAAALAISLAKNDLQQPGGRVGGVLAENGVRCVALGGLNPRPSPYPSLSREVRRVQLPQGNIVRDRSVRAAGES
jgi:hypothetical protein